MGGRLTVSVSGKGTTFILTGVWLQIRPRTLIVQLPLGNWSRIPARMAPRRARPQLKHDPVREGRKLTDTSRNERQKAVLLCELGRLQREQVSELVKNGKDIVEQSKKLCQNGAPENPSRRKRAG